MASAPAAQELLSRYGSPLYVYDAAAIRARCRALRAMVDHPRVDVLYAMKANANPSILRIIRDEGLEVDAVSEGEVEAALRAGFPPAAVSFNGNNVTDAEMRAVRARGVHVTVDSIPQLERFGRLFPGVPAGVRINPDIGDGHHDHVVTGGAATKFGVEHDRFADVLAAARRAGTTIDLLQQHIGSGLLDPAPYLEAALVLLRIAPAFPDLRALDFGGGFGIPYRPGEQELDLVALGEQLRRRILDFEKKESRELRWRFEPGRYVVATAGTLYCTVTAVKRGKTSTFAGTDTGFHHLLRPTLYDAWHPVENVSNPSAPVERFTVVGNLCESGDVLARDRALPRCREGDILAIRNAGAYGYSMASTYNLRPRPAEVLIEDGGVREIRRRETIDDLLSGAGS